jgi:phosphohistidine phosphatase
MGHTLYLLRHAKSSWDDPTLADHDRPLSSRGRRASRVIADYLGRQAFAPGLVLCSSARRTRETLERISTGLDQKIAVRIEDGLYEASAGDLLAALRAVHSHMDSVLLIGHNPAIQQLAVALAGTGAQLEPLREKFPTAALATLAFQADWSELAPGAAELVAFVRPRDLGQMSS